MELVNSCIAEPVRAGFLPLVMKVLVDALTITRTGNGPFQVEELQEPIRVMVNPLGSAATSLYPAVT